MSIKGNQAGIRLSHNFTSLIWLLLLHVCRVSTFLINILVSRYVSRSIFAINVQLQFLLNLLLSFSREGFRFAILKVPFADDPSTQSCPTAKNALRSAQNFGRLCIPLNILLNLIIIPVSLCFSIGQELDVLNYKEVVWMFGISSVIETFYESFYLQTQILVLFRVRAILEFVAVLVKALNSYIFTVYFNYGLLAFGLAQIFYSVSLLLGYWIYFLKFSPIQQLPPSKTPQFAHGHNSTVKQPFWIYWLTFEWQTIQKTILYGGEYFLLRIFFSLKDQAIHASVIMLRNSAARILFQWLEEGLFPVFSQSIKQIRNSPITVQQDMLSHLQTLLFLLIRAVVTLGLIVLSIGPNYTFLLLEILFTNKYSRTYAPLLLSWELLHIFTLGLSTILESFTFSIASSRTLNVFNLYILVQSIILYLCFSQFPDFLAAPGTLVALNIAVTITKIVIYAIYIMRFFKKRIPKTVAPNLVPSLGTFLVLIVVFTATRISEKRCSQRIELCKSNCLIHVMVGGICFLSVLLSISKTEKSYLMEVTSLIKDLRSYASK